MNYHLIIGYGYWSKKNLAFLSRKKIFDSIIIKSRKNYFFFSDGSIIKKDHFNEIKKKIISMGVSKVDYIKLVDLKTLKRPRKNKFNLFYAIYIGKVRLIDNF